MSGREGEGRGWGRTPWREWYCWNFRKGEPGIGLHGLKFSFGLHILESRFPVDGGVTLDPGEWFWDRNAGVGVHVFGSLVSCVCREG